MSKLARYRKLTLGLLGTLCFFSPLLLPLNAAIISTQQSLTETNADINNNYIALSWREIWEKIKRKKVAGGTRGNICAISPGKLVDVESVTTSFPNDRSANSYLRENYPGHQNQIWHQNPLFVWQSGTLDKIALRNEDGFFWEQKVTAFQSHLFYNGKPLELGKTYRLVVFETNGRETEIYKVRIVALDRYQQIADDLKERQIEAKAIDREEIALAKADYFIEQEMWSDALWELYSVPEPSHRLKTTLELIKKHNFCQN